MTRLVFWDCLICNTRFVGSDLRGSAFSAGTHLVEPNFGSADLTDVDFSEAIVERANFNRVNLKGADLRGIDLRTSYNLTQEQIETAIGNADTRLPDGLSVPQHWHS